MQQDKEQIREAGNKLIAEFMGYKIVDRNGYSAVIMHEPYSEYLHLWAKYHSSWDWLHKVIDKIIKIVRDNKENINWQLFHEDVDASKILHLKIFTDIETAYLAVLSFLDYHKSNPS